MNKKSIKTGGISRDTDTGCIEVVGGFISGVEDIDGFGGG